MRTLRTLLLTLSLAAVFAVTLLYCVGGLAQPAPGAIVSTLPVCSVTTSGTTTAVLGVNSDKTYHASGSVASGTGTFAVTLQGSNDAGASWVTVGTFSIPLTPTPAAPGGLSSVDRLKQLRCNVTTLSGATPTAAITMGY